MSQNISSGSMLQASGHGKSVQPTVFILTSILLTRLYKKDRV